MTDHADLSRRLALAIGWFEGAYTYPTPRMIVQDSGRVTCWDGKQWRPFDYRDPVIAWRVAEHFDCFPWKNGGTEWCVLTEMKVYYGDTAAEAVARAVIGARG